MILTIFLVAAFCGLVTCVYLLGYNRGRVDECRDRIRQLDRDSKIKLW